MIYLGVMGSRCREGERVDVRDNALVALGRQLILQNYQFITPTPETHRRVLSRAERAGTVVARDLRDVFGWSRPFSRTLLPEALFALLHASGELHTLADKGLYRANVRFSRLGSLLLVHSAYPTEAPDSVFFGPDTYRFARLLAAWAPPAQRAIDLGCGSGASGLVLRGITDLHLTDINERALRYARINVALNDAEHVRVAHSDLLRDVPGDFDLIVANPPYMHDAAARTYRDGGGRHGEALAARIVREAFPRLSPGGTLIVYTGAAIVAGDDTFAEAVVPWLRDQAGAFQYEELDPDVFGEELEQPAYGDVERIAAVGLRVKRAL